MPTETTATTTTNNLAVGGAVSLSYMPPWMGTITLGCRISSGEELPVAMKLIWDAIYKGVERRVRKAPSASSLFRATLEYRKAVNSAIRQAREVYAYDEIALTEQLAQIGTVVLPEIRLERRTASITEVLCNDDGDGAWTRLYSSRPTYFDGYVSQLKSFAESAGFRAHLQAMKPLLKDTQVIVEVGSNRLVNLMYLVAVLPTVQFPFFMNLGRVGLPRKRYQSKLFAVATAEIPNSTTAGRLNAIRLNVLPLHLPADASDTIREARTGWFGYTRRELVYGDVRHPHLTENRLCWGPYSNVIQRMLAQHNLAAIAETAQRVWRVYNPLSPHFHLEETLAKACPNCWNHPVTNACSICFNRACISQSPFAARLYSYYRDGLRVDAPELWRLYEEVAQRRQCGRCSTRTAAEARRYLDDLVTKETTYGLAIQYACCS